MLVMETSTSNYDRHDPPPSPPFQGGERTERASSGGTTAPPPLEKGRSGLGSEPQSLTDLTASLREHILEAQDMLARGDIKGAEALGKATLQLIRAVEAQVKLEDSQTSEEQDGVFIARADIEAARADLMRRMDRIAKRLRPTEMAGDAQ